MKKIPSILLLTALIAVVLPSSRVSAADSAEISVQVNFNTRFAMDLFGRLKTGEGNFFFSPYSISSCMAMVFAGAQEDTELQMARVLHFNTNQEVFHSVFSELQGQVEGAAKPGELELRLANGLWSQRGHPFNAAFLEIGKQLYGANIMQVDFKKNAEPVRKLIDGFVKERTGGKIPDLIPQGLINGTTRLVVVNAIYFKGKWEKPFKKEDTADAPFTVAVEKKVTAPLMHTTAEFNYGETPDMQVLEMPYGGGRLSMVVLLPKGSNEVDTVENVLRRRGPDALLSQASMKKVDVSLPKFRLTGQFLLSKELKEMGMPAAFTSEADFFSMDDMHDLYLTEVVHKAFIEVNEEGTEAAAATGVTVAMTAVPMNNPVFRADHPFVFLIRDMQSRSVLFLGRVANPTK